MLAWRHASYARSLILLFVNFWEAVLLYAIFYAVALPRPNSLGTLDFILLSLATFFGQTVSYVNTASIRQIDALRLSELLVAFFLVTVGLAGLVNMMAQGREVYRDSV